MNLRNTSPYHTATLRRIFALTFRAIKKDGKGRPDQSYKPKIVVEEGRTRLRGQWEENARVPTLLVRIPKLKGDEFIPLLRQQHGTIERHPAGFGPSKTYGALLSADIALLAQRSLYEVLNLDSRQFGRRALSLEVGVRLALQKGKIPEYVPLRIHKPPKEEEPRDVISERYKRILELEARWKTKLKLSQTKLKKLQLKRRKYEKQLAKRNTTKETQCPANT